MKKLWLVLLYIVYYCFFGLALYAGQLKLTIDHTNVDTSLSNFPILVHLGSASGINSANTTTVFTELVSDVNRKKISVTTESGVELYVEIEKWDTANKQAWLWVKVPSISNTEDTILYLNYDKNRTDNTASVGDTGSVAAKAVWDSRFQTVLHFAEQGSGSTGEYKDSTMKLNGTANTKYYNSNDYGPITYGPPTMVTNSGLIGNAQFFDGVNDLISVPDADGLSWNPTKAITVSWWFVPTVLTWTKDSQSSEHYINMMGKADYGDYPTGDMIGWEWEFGLGSKYSGSEKNQEITHYVHHPAGGGGAGAGNYPDGGVHYGYIEDGSISGPAYNVGDKILVVGRMDATNIWVDTYYHNGYHLQDGSANFGNSSDCTPDTDCTPANTASNFNIGTMPTQGQMFEGIMDEVRVSNVFRSDAWLKSSYYSESDKLLTYTVTSTPSDTTQPLAITTLSTGIATSNSVVLSWTSVGDDGNIGTATTYDIRYATFSITTNNWNSVTQCNTEPTPLVAGNNQTYTVNGLNANTQYYFAMKAADEAPNWSGISNVISKATTSIRIMPLGDSITHQAYSYRVLLWTKLHDAGWDFDFVGSTQVAGDQCVDINQEGWGGYRIDTSSKYLDSWITKNPSDIVLLHLGTNDINQNYLLLDTTNRLSTLIDKITTRLPDAKVYVASIIPCKDNPATTTRNEAAQTVAYNNGIPGVISAKQSQGKKVYFVDIYNEAHISTTTDFASYELLHPNSLGADKMANVWYNHLTGITPNNPPIASDQSVNIFKDTTKQITLTATDADNNSLIYSTVTTPGHGTLSGTVPNVTYTPASGYTGADSFTFKVNDGESDSNVATISIIVSELPTQQAYPAGVAWVVGTGTTTIQSEDYDMLTTGIGEGEAYHDTTTGNSGGGVYRTTENVDVQVCTDTVVGYNIGWTKPGEWLEYSINVNQGGEYKIILRGANGLTTNGGPIHLEFGTHKESAYIKTSSVSIPPTGSYGTWADVTLSTGITLTAGNQIMKLVMETSAAAGCGNFNYIKLIKVTADTPNTVETPTISPGAGTYADSITITLGCATSGAEIRYTTNGTDPTSSSTLYSSSFTLTTSATVRVRAFKDTMTDSSVNSVAYVITIVSSQQSYGNSGNPWQIGTETTTIQIENYDTVTSGSASGETYNDTTTGNSGGAYRTTENVDIGVCTDTDGGYYIGWTAPNEWLEYSVNVNQGGEYKIILRAANGLSSASPVHLEFGTHKEAPYIKTSSVTIPSTGGWDKWANIEVSSNVSLTQGNQIMKLVMETGSVSGNGNFNHIKLVKLTADTTPPTISVVTPTNITDTGAVITWTTNEPSNSKVEYGLTASYGSVTPATDTAGIYNHNVTLSGLAENTVYHYRMVSVDMNSNTTTTGDYIFTTIAKDSNPPVISNVRASVTQNNAVITWTTDENSDSQVAYGTSTALGSIATLDSTLIRLHSVSISGLQKAKTYYYKVYSRDAVGNIAESTQYSFKTSNIKYRIYTYYYDDLKTNADLKFKVQVYNDDNNVATDYAGTVTLKTINSKSSLLDKVDATLIESDSGEKEISVPLRSNIDMVELSGDTTAPILINFSDMYIAKFVGYQGGSIRGANGLKILIPTGVLPANKFLAAIKTSASPAVRNTMKYVNTINPICYDFGELTFNNNAPVLQNQLFTRAVNITLPYAKTDIGTLNEDGLRIYYWTGTDWELVEGVQIIDKINKTLTATVKHFSTYRILGSYISADMSNIKIYPNPYNPDTAVQGKLKIINLPINSVMKLYSVSGRLARELKEVDFGNLGWLEWDGKNDDGDKVGRGMYIYQIEDGAGNKKTGKIGLVK
ncbi:MAG: DUF2341 domain-containing protein [Elusimicrobia bacterium]|nr:DUF2341 domain-containing protein [Elusimicrobiota bacterium]